MAPEAAVLQGEQFQQAQWAGLHAWFVDHGAAGYETAADIAHDEGGTQVGVCTRWTFQFMAVELCSSQKHDARRKEGSPLPVGHLTDG